MQGVNNQVLGDAEAPPIFVYSIIHFVMEYPALEYLAFWLHTLSRPPLNDSFRPNKWRLIINFSVPEGYSMNDGVGKELSSVSYISVDDVAAHN